MKRLLPAFLTLTCATSLVACAHSSDDAPLAGAIWQVVALHTEPGMSGELPPDAAGKVSLQFGGSSDSAGGPAVTELVMTTGCAPLKAEMESSENTLRLHQVELGEVGDCVGGSRYVHDLVTGLLVPGAELSVHQLSDTEATLTVETDAIDNPSMRIMAL